MTVATLKALGISESEISQGDLVVRSPVDGAILGRVRSDTAAEVDARIAASQKAFHAWRDVPAPRRGELVRLFGEELRANKEALGRLVTLEAGKIVQEGLGEVQEMIDICDFAVGLSRQLYGLTIASERPGHRMMETWHPLGPVGVISAFNFPVAVWAWNACLAFVCGDSVIWKPSEKTPLTALATQKLFEKAVACFGDAPQGLSQLIQGGRGIGEQLAADARVPLVSATGSTRMGKALAPVVAARLGRTILELGGNNAMIVAPSADLKLAERAITFAAVGTAGQRCTTTRRLIVHASVVDALLERLERAYKSVPIGDPLDARTLMGPLIDDRAVAAMREAITKAMREGCSLVCGGIDAIDRRAGQQGHFVEPTILRVPRGSIPAITREETFAPILYVFTVDSLDEAMTIQNGVDQGLSSAIFTDSVRSAERFLSAAGSDCGIANVNIGTSGAEIGGAFGGEKDTGGGRESGSDSWKSYMRRQTCTINWGGALPLAQGIRFGE